jgi:hypothetical protein
MTRLRTGIRSKAALLAIGLAWAVVVAGGVFWLMRFQMTPGQAAAASPKWPGAGIAKLAADRPTLLMFVHPECSCSQASLGELQQLMTACPNRLAILVLFFKPSDQAEDWSHTDLWKDAISIPGVEARIDSGGRLAERFGAKTSGQVMVYSPQGRLLFNGGITDGRGHFGDNAALDALIAIARGSAPASVVVTSKVYGCSINSPTPLVSSGAASPPGKYKP